MPANECIPIHKTGDVTAKAGAAITGKRFVKVNANRESGPGLSSTSEGGNYVVVQCVAGDRAVGVAAYDAAINTKVGIEGQTGSIVPVTSGAAVTAGAPVMSDANGKAITWVSAASEANKMLGTAMSGAAGADVELEVKLTI